MSTMKLSNAIRQGSRCYSSYRATSSPEDVWSESFVRIMLFAVAVVLLAGLITQDSSEGASNVSITRTQDCDRRYTPGEVIFQDEFDFFDLEVWMHESTLGGANWEFNMYINSRENSYVKDGKLFIKPTLTADALGDEVVFGGQLSLQGAEHEGCTSTINFGCMRSGSYPYIVNPVRSAKITTMKSFYFKYGRLEVRAKIPAGDWLWPAIWMMPRFNGYGLWPRSGEIDILESRGNRKYFDSYGANIGVETVTSTTHFGPDWMHNGYQTTFSMKTSESDHGFDRDFHVYGLEWTDDHITFMLDGQVVRRVDPPEGGFWQLGGFWDELFNPWNGAENKRMAPFDQKFYLILNVAVGGTTGYFPDVANNSHGPRPWWNEEAMRTFYEARDDWYSTWDGEDAAMQIDYVRVYAV